MNTNEHYFNGVGSPRRSFSSRVRFNCETVFPMAQVASVPPISTPEEDPPYEDTWVHQNQSSPLVACDA